ncbi:hypothetical protein BOTBODRAFT_348163 [Botryobasidium botryosum FD-172 SS1]|uniref:Uncharacterized protein n=1 Tax=Botryobasidium botryosum (strain FD-172 SS1) TaxID=930990 RepID=A0A067MR13_BOTB1|nr:hypothetical protein BOTBODRAFT_348163 [Botryobasidium botryosum FD-172 SS1]
MHVVSSPALPLRSHMPSAEICSRRTAFLSASNIYRNRSHSARTYVVAPESSPSLSLTLPHPLAGTCFGTCLLSAGQNSSPITAKRKCYVGLRSRRAARTIARQWIPSPSIPVSMVNVGALAQSLSAHMCSVLAPRGYRCLSLSHFPEQKLSCAISLMTKLLPDASSGSSGCRPSCGSSTACARRRDAADHGPRSSTRCAACAFSADQRDHRQEADPVLISYRSPGQ